MENLYIQIIRKLIIVPFLCIAFQLSTFAQTPTVQDCLGAIPLCQNTYVQPNFYSGTGNYLNEINSSGGSCLLNGEINDVWYVFTVVSSGQLSFVIQPNSLLDDFDWAIYNVTNANCSDIYNNPGLQVCCNYSKTSGITGMTNSPNASCNAGPADGALCPTVGVTSGQTYVINVSSNAILTSGYTLDFSASTASIVDHTPPVFQSVNTSSLVCGSNQLSFTFTENVLCSTVSVCDFILTGPGGPYTISAISGAGCSVGALMENTFTISFSPPISQSGMYNIALTNSCGSVTDNCGNVAPPNNSNFYIFAPGAIINPSSVTICSTTCVSLNASGGTNYLWSDGLGTNPNVSVCPPSTTTYYVTATSVNCTSTASVTVNVDPLPNVVVPANIVVCKGANVPATAFTSSSPGATFAWTNSNTAIGLPASGTGNVPAFTATNIGPNPITATISVTSSANNCNSPPATYTITVNPTPAVTVPSNIVVCKGAVVPATAFTSSTPGATFAWTNSNTAIGLGASGNGNVPSFTATNTGTLPITATITVTPSANGCPGIPSSYTITVNPAPNVVVPANIVVCKGAIIPATNFTSSTPGTTFTWTNSNTAIGLAASGSGNVPSFTATNSGPTPITATITVTPSASSCPGIPSSYTITVNPMATVTVPANIVVCSGATVSATNFTSTTPGTTFAWTNSNTAIGLGANGIGNVPSFTATNPGATPITATITVTPSANSCPGTPSTYTITVNPAPIVVVPANIIVCVGATVPATNFTSTTPGTTFTWTNSNTAIGLGANGIGNIPSFTATNAGTTPITATITVTPSANSCPGIPSSYTITVEPKAIVTVPANIVVCSGATVPATNFTSTSPGATFTWTNSNTAIGLGANGIGNVPSFTATNPGATPITATITVTPSVSSCPGTASTYTITVNPAPNVIVPANIVVCVGATVPATNFTSTTPGTTFTWTNSNTAIGLGANGIGNVPAFTATNPGTTPITATITVTPSANSCPGIPSSYTITVEPKATVTVPANIIVCSGATVPATNFTSTTPGATFTWTNSNTAIGLGASGSGNVPAFTATNPGATPITATITVTPTVSSCPGTPSTYTITVNPAPNVIVPANIVVCVGATVPATNFTSTTPGTTFTWTNSNTAIGLGANGIGNVPAFIATNPGTTPITATITVTPSANSCPGIPSSYTITVNPIPIVIVPANIVVCSGATVPATNFTSTTPGATFTWTNSNTAIGLGANGIGNVPAFTATNPGATPITATITVTPTVSSCPGTPSTYTITVNPAPNVIVPANIVVCVGATVPATNFTSTTPGTTFTWTNSNTAIGLGANGIGNVPAFIATNPGTTPITATITVTPSANSCPGIPSSYTITVNPAAIVVVPANMVVCAGAIVPATNFTSTTPGTTFSWTNSNTAIGLGANGIGNVPSFTATNPGNTPITATITVTPSANSCPGIPSSYTITVEPKATVTVPANIVVCSGAIVPATNFTSTPPGATFTWTNSNTAIGLGANGSGNVPSFTATNPGATPITATITVTPTLGGCAGTASTYTITVNPAPNVIVPANIVVCVGATVPATNFTSTTPGTTFTWTNSNTAIGLGANGIGNVPAFIATNPGTTPITATITVTPSANSCPGIPSSYTITVNPIPIVIVPANIVVCSGATVPATNFTSTTPGATFTWTNSNSAIGLGASGSGNVPSFTATNPGATPITATITVTPSIGSCTGTASTYTITVNPAPNVIVPANIVVCVGATVPATNFTSTTPGTTFTWTNSNTAIGLGANGIGNVPSFTATNPGTTPITATITVTPSANSCPGIPSSYTITVNPIPIVIVPANIVVCSGATVPATNFTSTTPGATFTWTNSNTAIGLGANGIGNVPSFTATNPGTTPITATITVTPSIGSCTGTASTYNITVNPAPNVIVPANIVVCVGATVPATNFTSTTPGTTFTWINSNTAIGLGANGIGNVPSFTATNPGTTPITATITVTPSANSCPGIPSSCTITVNPAPIVVVPANMVVCAGATVPATNFTSTTPGTTFSWTNSNTAIGLGANGIGNVPAFTATNPGTTPITATITVTPSAGSCAGTASTYTITVNPAPNVIVPANIVVCAGATVPATNFSSSTPGTTFTWTNSNTAIGLGANGSGNVPAFTATNPGATPIIATITVTPSVGGCAGTASTYTITINPAPNAIVPANIDVCAGATVPATNFTSTTPGTTFTWTNNNTAIGLGANGSGNIPAFTAINPGTTPITATITVTPSANSCPGISSTYTITVNPIPTVVVPANIVVCNGATVLATNFTSTTPGATFTWTNSNTAIGLGANGIGNVPAFTSTNPGTTPITATITVIPSINGCSGTSSSYTITVNPTATFTVPANIEVCDSASVPATSFIGSISGATFSWTNNNTAIGLVASGSGNVPSFIATNAGTLPITATITVTSLVNGCTSSPLTYTITVNPKPSVTVPANIVTCDGATVPATAFSSSTPGATFNWTNNNTAIGLGASGTGDVPAFTATNTDTIPIIATISVTPSANSCTGSPSTYTITVNPISTVTVPADTVVCNGIMVPATSFTSSLPGATFSWTNSNTAIGLAASGNGNVPAFTATNTGTSSIIGTITVTATLTSCTGSSSTYTITVNPGPSSTFTVTTPVCNSGSSAVQYTGNADSNAIYTWDFDGGTATPTGGLENYSVFWLTSGVYDISLSLTQNGCISNATTHSVIVSHLSIDATTTSNVSCLGSADGSANVTASNGFGNYVYLWSTSPPQNTQNVTNLGAGNYYVTVSDSSGCSQIDSVVISHPDLLTATAIWSEQVSCTNVNDGNITVSVFGGTAPYTYTLNGGIPQSSNIFSDLPPGTYNLLVTDTMGCTATISDMTITNPDTLSTIFVRYSNENCFGSGGGSVEVIAAGGTQPYSYLWSNGATSAKVDGLYSQTYYVTVSDINNCSGEFAIDVPKDPKVELVIRNSFSPNGDGKNDVWFIDNLQLYPENDLVIINRWGNEVYSVKGYLNDWDGNNLNEGTYFYVLKVNMCNDNTIYKGYITLLR